MSSSSLQYHLLLLVQAVVGFILALIGICQPVFTGSAVFYWFCLVVMAVDMVIIINSLVNIFFDCYARRRKEEYEDIEEGDWMGDQKIASFQEKTRKRIKKGEKKLKKLRAEIVKKEIDLEKREKVLKDSTATKGRNLYGGYGYCDYGHYHVGAPVTKDVTNK
jgi:hypothetical protein